MDYDFLYLSFPPCSLCSICFFGLSKYWAVISWGTVLEISLLKGKNSLESIVRHTEWSLHALPHTWIYIYQYWIWCPWIFQHSKGRRKRKYQWRVCVQKHTWMTALSAKPSRRQARLPEHPACPKCHSYKSGHTPVHGARFCNSTKTAWGCQARAPTLHGDLSPQQLDLCTDPAGTEASSSLHSAQEVSGLAKGTHWGKGRFLNCIPLRSSVIYFQTAGKSICQTGIHSL